MKGLGFRVELGFGAARVGFGAAKYTSLHTSQRHSEAFEVVYTLAIQGI